MQSLAGDSTDNIPGVRGIGVKTAAELINTYGDLETLACPAPARSSSPSAARSLIEQAEMARISMKLVTLDPDVAAARAGSASFGTHDPDPQDPDRLSEGDGIRRR